MNYVRIIDNDNCQEITKKGLFECLVKEQKMTYNLPDSFHFPYGTPLSRIIRKNLTAWGNGFDVQGVRDQDGCASLGGAGAELVRLCPRLTAHVTPLAALPGGAPPVRCDAPYVVRSEVFMHV